MGQRGVRFGRGVWGVCEGGGMSVAKDFQIVLLNQT